MDDINYEIVKLLSKVDKIHYLISFRYMRYLDLCGKEINRLNDIELEYLDRSILIYLFSYMTLDTINKLLMGKNIPLNFIELVINKYGKDDDLDWSAISRQKTLTPKIIGKYTKNLNWYALTKAVNNVPLDLFLEHIKISNGVYQFIKWNNVSKYNSTLTMLFVEKHQDLINWEYLCQNPFLNFPNKWWLKNIHLCKYFIFFKEKTSTKFLISCIKLTFNDLMIDSIRAMTKVQKYDYFLQNTLRHFYFITSKKSSGFIKIIHEFIEFAIIKQLHEYDDENDEKLRKQAYRHLKKLHTLNFCKQLLIKDGPITKTQIVYISTSELVDLILQFKRTEKDRNHF